MTGIPFPRSMVRATDSSLIFGIRPGLKLKGTLITRSVLPIMSLFEFFDGSVNLFLFRLSSFLFFLFFEQLSHIVLKVEVLWLSRPFSFQIFFDVIFDSVFLLKLLTFQLRFLGSQFASDSVISFFLKGLFFFLVCVSYVVLRMVEMGCNNMVWIGFFIPTFDLRFDYFSWTCAYRLGWFRCNSAFVFDWSSTIGRLLLDNILEILHCFSIVFIDLGYLAFA